MFSDNNRIKLDISNKKTSWKYPNFWRLNNRDIKNPGFKKNQKINYKPFLTEWKQKKKTCQIYDMHLKQYLEENL